MPFRGDCTVAGSRVNSGRCHCSVSKRQRKKTAIMALSEK